MKDKTIMIIVILIVVALSVLMIVETIENGKTERCKIAAGSGKYSEDRSGQ